MQKSETRHFYPCFPSPYILTNVRLKERLSLIKAVLESWTATRMETFVHAMTISMQCV